MMRGAYHAPPAEFDPLLIGILGCFAGVFLVASYHYVTTRCGNPGRDGVESENERQGNGRNRPTMWASGSESSSVMLSSYRHTGESKLDGTCAVCLGEFAEGEMIRALPECLHTFHAPCIDMWLYSHSSCPLCRASTRLLPLPMPYVLSVPDTGEDLLPESQSPASPPHTVEEPLPLSMDVTLSMPISSDLPVQELVVLPVVEHFGEEPLAGSPISSSTPRSSDDPTPMSATPSPHYEGLPRSLPLSSPSATQAS